MNKQALFTKMEQYVAEQIKKSKRLNYIPELSVYIVDSDDRPYLSVVLRIEEYLRPITRIENFTSANPTPPRNYFHCKTERVNSQAYGVDTALPKTVEAMTDRGYAKTLRHVLFHLDSVDEEFLRNPRGRGTVMGDILYFRELKQKEINDLIESKAMEDMGDVIHTFLHKTTLCRNNNGTLHS